MATKVVMEALSPTMEEGRLVKWLKNEGDAVKSGDVLAEVETDKAVMELVARGDGVLRKRIANEGDASPVGTLLAVIGTADENIDSIVGAAGAAAPAPAPAAAAAAATTAPAAAPTPSATSVPATPAESQGEASAPPQEKAAPAPVVASTGRAPGDSQRPQRPAGNGARPSAPPPPQAPGGRQRSSPLARRLASDRGIALGTISGSGPGGRIVKRDVETAVATGGQARSPATARAALEGDYKDIPLTQIRKTIAKRLAESNGPVPTFFLTVELDVTRASELREELAEMGDQYKASFNDIVIRAVAMALAEHPEVNAHWLGDRIRQFNRIHVGMAVAVEDGLITPVIFDADRKRMWDISTEAKTLAGKARERKLTPEQYTGSTFSVSNLGMFGVDQFTAIINPPEAGIIAVGGVEEKPVVIEKEVVLRKRMRITMSCDHRVIDGATGAKFLQTVRRLIENPVALIV
jgi:pyruvate dehydrogenase E2 component (dihydrolipoamide acetyltransferase)